MPRVIQTALSGGELSPSLHSHADLQKYQTGLAHCENWFVLSQGGITTRSGFEYVNEVIDDTEVNRLIPFQFNTEQAYALLFSNLAMRVVRNGAMVLEADKVITAATQANPIAITSTAHGYTTGDDVYISDIAGMTEINNRFFRITVTGANAYTLDGEDGTGYAAYTSGGTSGRIYTLVTPFVEADLALLKFTQSADVMTITHRDNAIQELSRTGHSAWTLSTVTFASNLSPPTGLAVTQTGTASGSPDKQYRYVVTSVDDTGDESVASAIVASAVINALSTTYGNEITWSKATGAAFYNVYKEYSVTSGIFGWIGEAADPASPVFKDYNFGPDMSVTPPLANNPFGTADNRPGCVTYHQQRLWFGSTTTNLQTLWASRTGDFDNMDKSRPTRSDDSIEATISARQVNEIRHLISLDELLIFTSGGEWKVTADQDGILTPENTNFRSQGFRGCSDVPPLVVGETALYIQEKGSRIRDLKYTFEDDRYVGDDLSVLARHLFEGFEICEWCYAQEPNSIVWAVRDDGVLLSLTYLREHNVYAWAKHVTDGAFESICSISEGNEDIVYVVVKRTINGTDKRYVERLHEGLFTDIRDAFHVDSGLSYSGVSYIVTAATKAAACVITATSHALVVGEVFWIRSIAGMAELNDRQFKVGAVSGDDITLKNFNGDDVDSTGYTTYVSGGTVQYSTTSISNLRHLAGETVVALVDGNVAEGLVVSADGDVTLPVEGSEVHIGMPYNCDIQTLEASHPKDVLQSRRKQIARVGIRTLESRGLSVGADANSLYAIKDRTVAMNYNNISPITAQKLIEVSPGWSDYGQIYVRQSYPLPATILAIIPEIDISG